MFDHYRDVVRESERNKRYRYNHARPKTRDQLMEKSIGC